MSSRIGWSGLAERLSTAYPLLTAVGAGLLIARYLAWQLRWSVAARHIGEDSRPARRFGAVCASVLLNHATPSIRIFGSLLRARYLARGGRKGFVPQYAVVLYEQMVHMVVSTAVVWLAGSAIAWRLAGGLWPPARSSRASWARPGSSAAATAGGAAKSRRGSRSPSGASGASVIACGRSPCMAANW
jgi:uncharacterized membrane protein YbhN (UPF0104 family)